MNALRLPIVGNRPDRAATGESRIWRAFIEGILRHRLVALTLTVGRLVALTVPVLGLHLGQSGVATLPGHLPSKEGYVAVQRYFPDQDPYPVEIVAKGGSPVTRRDMGRLEATLASERRFGPGTIQTSADGTPWHSPLRSEVTSIRS